MRKMFVPLHITALSVAGMEVEPDEERMVNVPDDKVEECTGHGLISADNEAAIEAYMATLEPADEAGTEEPEDEKPKAAKKRALPVKKGSKKR